MTRRTGCKAKRYNDQMMCDECTSAWDVNDVDAPACKKRQLGNETIATLLQAVEVKPDRDPGLVFFQQMPLTHLPGGGIAPGLFRVNWPDHPTLSYGLIEIPDLALGGMFNMRLYKFFSTKGVPQLQVQVDESGDKRRVSVRYHDERGNASPWQPA